MELFLLLLVGHFLGDFICQPYKLSQKKKESFWFLILHSFIYVFIFGLIIFRFFNNNLLIILLVLFISHLLIDYFRIVLDKKASLNKQFLLFIIDQILHVIIIFLIFTILRSKYNVIDDRISVLFAYLLILSPASIFIKHFINYVFRNKNDICDEEDNKIGSLIGKLERIIILTLGLMGLYTSIIIVITIKSIARFKQLDDKVFAEKYIVGTLLSLIFALIGLFVIRM